MERASRLGMYVLRHGMASCHSWPGYSDLNVYEMNYASSLDGIAVASTGMAYSILLWKFALYFYFLLIMLACK